MSGGDIASYFTTPAQARLLQDGADEVDVDDATVSAAAGVADGESLEQGGGDGHAEAFDADSEADGDGLIMDADGHYMFDDSAGKSGGVGTALKKTRGTGTGRARAKVASQSFAPPSKEALMFRFPPSRVKELFTKANCATSPGEAGTNKC